MVILAPVQTVMQYLDIQLVRVVEILVVSLAQLVILVEYMVDLDQEVTSDQHLVVGQDMRFIQIPSHR